jgi:hypothetical protein
MEGDSNGSKSLYGLVLHSYTCMPYTSDLKRPRGIPTNGNGSLRSYNIKFCIQLLGYVIPTRILQQTIFSNTNRVPHGKSPEGIKYYSEKYQRAASYYFHILSYPRKNTRLKSYSYLYAWTWTSEHWTLEWKDNMNVGNWILSSPCVCYSRS